MNKFVTYTVLVGDFSTDISHLEQVDSDYKKICFTDNKNLVLRNWDIVPVNLSLDAARESRRFKLLPHIFLKDFEWSLYIDTRVKLEKRPEIIWHNHATRSQKFFAFPHPDRNCIFDEAEIIIQHQIDHERRVREQMDYYKSLSYPRQAGLIAGGMLLRKHNEPDLIKLSETWFEHVLRFSKRDQLSFNFVANALKFEYGLFEGKLTKNDLMTWPMALNQLPPDFDEATYSWLNPQISQSALSPRKHYLEIGKKNNLAYSRPKSELERLANKYKSDKGSIYYNAHNYAGIYEKYLAKDRTRPLIILELGLLRHDIQARNPGGPFDDAPSLFMWKEYFPNSKIFGFDIADFSLVPDTENVEILRGDASNCNDLEKLIKKIGKMIDVIIDDASHASHHQQIALGYLFPYLAEDGFYFIEDLRYQPASIEKKDICKTIELLHNLKYGNKTELATAIPKKQLLYLQKNIDFIEFYDSHEVPHLPPDAFAIIKKVKSAKDDFLKRFYNVITNKRGH